MLSVANLVHQQFRGRGELNAGLAMFQVFALEEAGGLAKNNIVLAGRAHPTAHINEPSSGQLRGGAVALGDNVVGGTC